MTLRPGQSNYSYPAASFCHVFSFPLVLEGDGFPPDPSNPNVKLIWKNSFYNTCATGPSDEFPSDEDACDYWSEKKNSLKGDLPWGFLKKITLDDDHLIFRWDDCFYKFAALKLFPPGSQITIGFFGPGGTDFDYTEDPAEVGQGAVVSWAGCVYFTTDSYSRSESELDAYELRLNIPQFEAILGASAESPTYCNGPSFGCGPPPDEDPGPLYDVYGQKNLYCIDPALDFNDYFGTVGAFDNEGLYEFPRDVMTAYRDNWIERYGGDPDSVNNCQVVDPDEIEIPPEGGEEDPIIIDPTEKIFCPCFTEEMVDIRVEQELEEECKVNLVMEVRICTDGEHLTTF